MTQEEENKLLLWSDYQGDSGWRAKHAIQAYVEADIAIPDELKPFIQDMNLMSNNREHKKCDTDLKWRAVVMTIQHHRNMNEYTFNETLNDCDVKYLIEELLGEDFDIETLTRRYRDRKWRELKDMIDKIYK